MVAGVCAGVARALGIDPTWVRLAVVALTVFGSGAGLLLYAIGWVVLPQEAEPAAYVRFGTGGETGDDGGWTAAGATDAWVPVTARRPGSALPLLGGLLVALGAVLLLTRLGLPALAWPMILVAAGMALVIGTSRR